MDPHYDMMVKSTNFIDIESDNEYKVIETDKIKIHVGASFCEYFIDNVQYTFLNSRRPTYDFMKFFLPKVGMCARGGINGNPPGDSSNVDQVDLDEINKKIDDFKAQREKR